MAIDPWGAGLTVGGNMLGALFGEDPEAPVVPRTYTGLGSQQQVSGLNKLLGMLMSGGGDFGSGAATKQANATLMESLANRGIDPNSKFAVSKQADMLGQIAGQDASRRGQMMMSAINARPWTVNYQNLGQGWQGVPGYGQAAQAGAGMPLTGWGPLDRAIRKANASMGQQYLSGGTY